HVVCSGLLDKNARGVLYLFKIQSVGRHVLSGLFAVPALDNGNKLLLVDLSGPDIQQRSDNRPDHSAQKPISRNGEDKLITPFDPAGSFDFANKVIYVRFDLAEAFKIAFADHVSGGAIHFVQVQRLEVMPAQSLQERILHAGDLIP